MHRKSTSTVFVAITAAMLLAPVVAMAGGAFGIFAAMAEEVKTISLFGMFVAGPAVEELVKPCGVYLLLAKWPQALLGRLHTACLAGLAGLTFAAIENIAYLEVGIDNPDRDIILWRWTVCTLIHTGCSFILGFGINSKLVASFKGEASFLKGNRLFFLIPIVIHGSYNTTVYFLETRWDWW